MPILVHCPFHDDSTPSLALYGDHAYCFGGCGRIALEDLPEDVREACEGRGRVEGEVPRAGMKASSLVGNDLKRMIRLWHWMLVEGPRKQRLSWLASRGIDEGAVRRFLLGHTGSWFVIPILVGKEIRGVRFRRDDLYARESDPRYKNPPGQQTSLYRPNPGGWPLVVTEGEFDAMLLSLCDCDAVTSTGGAGSLVRDLEREGILSSVRKRGRVLHVAVDQDDAGEAVARRLAELVPVVRWRWEEGKDVSEVLARLPREQWKDWVRTQLRGGLSVVSSPR